MRLNQSLRWIFCIAAAAVIACFVPSMQAQNSAPTIEDARAFLDKAEKELYDLGVKSQRAGWVQENFITFDTEEIFAEANEAITAVGVRLSKEAYRFDKLKLPPELARKMTMLKLGTILPSPSDAAKQAELARIEASLDSDYGKGKWCPDGPEKKCLTLRQWPSFWRRA